MRLNFFSIQSLTGNISRLFYLLLCCCVTVVIRANDTTRTKPVWLLTPVVGVTSNFVGGSMPKLNEQLDKRTHLQDIVSASIGTLLQRQFGSQFFVTSGLVYLQKQAKTQQGSRVVYKDNLKTGFLTIPVLAGVRLFPISTTRINLAIDAGPQANIRFIEHTAKGPDRVAIKKPFFGVSGTAGLQALCRLSSTIAFVGQYHYVWDISDPYTITLYWGSPTDTYRNFTYRFRTHSIQAGLQIIL